LFNDGSGLLAVDASGTLMAVSASPSRPSAAMGPNPLAESSITSFAWNTPQTTVNSPSSQGQKLVVFLFSFLGWRWLQLIMKG
jgi:hypothetical protein